MYINNVKFSNVVGLGYVDVKYSCDIDIYEPHRDSFCKGKDSFMETFYFHCGKQIEYMMNLLPYDSGFKVSREFTLKDVFHRATISIEISSPKERTFHTPSDKDIIDGFNRIVRHIEQTGRELYII